ncbi:hypothetical protein TIFTF001_017819 [Ficus carica]|uniref:Uncharacterized protein n=1 Tax=Ficus carica TaxID=3494 RepID=A0AA88ACZ8_FICCA|nr:hypothetical protein TIFTF001_017819 [Ficus carica]
MLSANMIEKGQGKAQTAPHVSSSQEFNVQKAEQRQGKAQTAPHVSSSQEFNVQKAESDVLQTTSPDIGVVADMGVQAAMEFLTADKVIVSHEDAENEKNKEESIPNLEKGIKEEKDDKEIIREHDVIKLEEPANEESILAVIPKKKRARLSRLGQRPSGRMTEVGSPSKTPSKLIYALPPGLADEPPKETLEEFREWINKGVLKRTPPGKRPPRYNAKHETLDKPHDLGFMVHIDVAFYYLMKKIRQFPELEQRKVTTVDTFFSSKVRSLWRVYQSSPDKFDWGSCESILKIMLGVCVQTIASIFCSKTKVLQRQDFFSSGPMGLHPLLGKAAPAVRHTQ